MQYEFLSAALYEFEEAVSYYDAIGFSLGDNLTDEIEKAIRRIIEDPERYPKIVGNVRRCLLKRFPYGICYKTVRGNMGLIIAVAHLKREPNYWKERIKNVLTRG